MFFKVADHPSLPTGKLFVISLQSCSHTWQYIKLVAFKVPRPKWCSWLWDPL